MLKKTITLSEAARFHARPAAMIVETANRFESMICLEGDGTIADCKRPLSLMRTRIPVSGTIVIVAEGSDEQEALAAIETLLCTMYWR
ncbi:MAG: HPr family phosphocarrier protein [Lachnospiraceae bacterium]|nr:HPr family phosphocarrier protein [Lachnospiraceae bacterium]